MRAIQSKKAAPRSISDLGLLILDWKDNPPAFGHPSFTKEGELLSDNHVYNGFKEN
jgi:hypothetical protein